MTTSSIPPCYGSDSCLTSVTPTEMCVRPEWYTPGTCARATRRPQRFSILLDAGDRKQTKIASYTVTICSTLEIWSSKYATGPKPLFNSHIGQCCVFRFFRFRVAFQTLPAINRSNWIVVCIVFFHSINNFSRVILPWNEWSNQFLHVFHSYNLYVICSVNIHLSVTKWSERIIQRTRSRGFDSRVASETFSRE